MAGKNNLKRQILWIFLCTVVVSLGFLSCVSQELDNTVQKAYELRMNGQADSAKALLEQAISQDSTNAIAHYELARTLHHMALGNPGTLADRMEEAWQAIEKSMEHDPDNVIYAFFAGNASFMQAYGSLMWNRPDVKEKVAKACGVYESALMLKPDYHEAMLHLVEIYSWIPNDKGGDSAKAEQYAKQLEGMDEVFGAKAREMLLPEEVDRIDHWQKVVENNEGNADAIEELGKAHLRKDEVDEAVKCFEEAVRINPQKNILFLDLARYHIMAFWRDRTVKDTALPLAEAAIRKYLESEPIPPLKAFALGLLSRIKRGLGDNTGAEELNEEAEAVDPYYSKSSGIPSLNLFVPPDEISHNHGYFSRPF